MDSFFSAIGYLIFGKRWVLFGMKHGLKTAVFVNEMEIGMQKANFKTVEARLEELKNELDFIKGLEDGKEKYEKIKGVEANIKGAETEVKMAEGELQRIYSITRANRDKLDYVRNFKMGQSYGDVPQGEFKIGK